jgi:DNA-binding transcriptional ArsR family regulator
MAKKTAKSAPVDITKFKGLCSTLKLLSGAPRCLQVCLFLVDQSATVTEICAHCEANQPAVSHHLQYLRVRALVTTSREGKFIRYTASDELKTLINSLSVLLKDAA